MGTNKTALAGLGLVAAGLLACQGKDEQERPGGITIGAPSGPVASPQGHGGDDSDSTIDGSIEGVVVQLLNDSFSSTSAFPGGAEVTIASPDNSASVESRYDGVEFVADGDVFGERWVYVEPDDQSAYPTITAHRLDRIEASIPVVARTVLEQIFQNLTTPADLNRGRAQFLLRVVDSADNGVPGVVADSFAASVPVIAYKEDAIWAAYLDATTAEGLAFVPNLEAPGYPGQITTVVLTGAIDMEVDVRLARGAVTVFTVVVP